MLPRRSRSSRENGKATNDLAKAGVGRNAPHSHAGRVTRVRRPDQYQAAEPRIPDHAIGGELAGYILSHVREVVIVLARDGRVSFANPAARRLLARRDPLLVRRGRLTTASSVQSLAVDRAIDAVCSSNDMRTETVVLRASASLPLMLTVICLDHCNGESILVLASDGHVDAAGLLPSLRYCFGLTTSEAEVASALAAGRSSGSIAASRGVRVNTIRTQIKSIAAKLGCATQSQISAIVRATPPSADVPN